MRASPCFCSSGKDYAHCCKALHDGAPAADAEALMRSRYAAFVLGRADYLLASWHSSTRPENLTLEADVKWLGLSVQSHHCADPDHATVAFVARWRQGGGSAQRLVEVSRFVREDGRWFYLDAQP